MNKKRILSVCILLVITLLLQFIPVAYADETNNSNEESTEIAEGDTQEEEEKEEVEEDKEKSDNETTLPTGVKTDNDQNSDEIKTTRSPNEEHKVAVVTTKVDENGAPLKGAVLQILDSNGNVVDEWTSNGEAHTSLLTEGTYTLHEKEAPEGYQLAADKTFTVEVIVPNLDAGVDFSETPCPHYGGTPLYYVEIEGKKYEVYCINQDWETPDDNSIYDGAVLSPEDIRKYTQQTVFIDAQQNKDKIDISDQSLSSEELYDKLLDIIYHRQLASDIFTDLTEAEIRYVTESAIKNYMNAGLTRVQGVTKISDIPEGVDDYYFDGRYYWYLYTHYRSFIYNPDAPLGTDVFITSVGNGDAFGTLARHWNGSDKNGIHNAKNSEEVRAKLARYYELYLYLIGDNNHHPSDMHLYVYGTNNTPTSLSGNNFDGSYQNLLGIHWYSPHDENHKVYLTMVNKKVPTKEKKQKKVKKSSIINPQTGDNIVSYIITLTLSIGSLAGVSSYRRKEF